MTVSPGRTDSPSRRLVRSIRAHRAATRWAAALVEPDFSGGLPALNAEGTFVVGARLQSRTKFGMRPMIYVARDASLHIGDDVFLNFGSMLQANRAISIGSRTMIGDHAVVMDTNYHEVAPGDGIRSGPVVIGEAVWLGHGVIVLPGVTIGDGSVVAAGSVVTRDLPSHVMAAGAPARVVREFAPVPPGYRRHGPFSPA